MTTPERQEKGQTLIKVFRHVQDAMGQIEGARFMCTPFACGQTPQQILLKDPSREMEIIERIPHKIAFI